MRRNEMKRILKRVLTKPTAPFREEHVIQEVERFAEKAGYPITADPYGNRIIIYKPKGRAKKGRIGFVAHMDHPGFEIIESTGKIAIADWTGGVRPEFFKNAAVCVHHEKGVKGQVTRVTYKDGPTPPRGFKRVDTMTLKMDAPVPVGAMGQWDLMDYKMDGTTVVTRAADDLCSVSALLALLKELKEANVRHEVWLIFTRAEENGFTGAMAMLEAKVLPKDLVLISLETSKILPGAEQGHGPVIRQGDFMGVYSSSVLIHMTECANRLKTNLRGFKFQKRVMDGGTCEATAFLIYGFQSAGIAFPLGNYHNMGDKPDKNGKPVLRAETVHIEDLQHGVELMIEMAASLSDLPGAFTRVRKRLNVFNKPFYKRLKENR